MSHCAAWGRRTATWNGCRFDGEFGRANGTAPREGGQDTAHAELSQKKRLYDGALAFHDYKVADRLFTKQENEKIALQQEEIEINTELAG